MSNDESGHTAQLLPHMVNGFLHFSFINFVKSTRGFIEDKYAGLFDKSTGEGNSLLLTA